MVRHKARWMLVQFDFDRTGSSIGEMIFPSKKEILLMIRQSISSNFGIAADGAAMETQVRFVDAKTRLVLVRVPREFCNMIRCSLTMLTHNVTKTTSRRPTLVASVLSVNGSARTAKLATIARIQKEFQIPIRTELPNPTESLLLQELQSLIVTIQNID